MLTSLALLAVAGFQFSVPPGWTDLSTGAPEANFQKAPPELVEIVRSNAFAFYAADLAGAEDGFIENVSAVVTKGEISEVDEDALDEVVERTSREIGATVPGATYRAIEKGFFDIGGVRAGRIIGESAIGVSATRQLLVLIPGNGEHVWLTYSSSPAKFSEYLPIFEAAARATRGAKQPPPRAIGTPVIAAAVAAVLIGGGLAIFLSRRKKRA